MTAVNCPTPLRVADFDYVLPPELVAQRPLKERDRSRLMVLDRVTGQVDHASFRDLRRVLRRGDLVVVNDSRVLPARLQARKIGTGGRVELLLLRRDGENGHWQALAKPARRLRTGMRLLVMPKISSSLPAVEVTVQRVLEDGEVEVHLGEELATRLEAYGEAPLPPYIDQPLEDAEQYQTVYAAVPGSAAAPTAGLHFTRQLVDDLRQRGVDWAEVTLHVGLDTFRPMTVDDPAEHRIHREWCSVSRETVQAIRRAKAGGGRVIAVGTTAARTLETWAEREGADGTTGWTGMTDLFILPGYQWRVVDALLTNFHLPKSTLLMMVSAFAGRDIVRGAYQSAIEHRYRFYSFGDAMIIT